MENPKLRGDVSTHTLILPKNHGKCLNFEVILGHFVVFRVQNDGLKKWWRKELTVVLVMQTVIPTMLVGRCKLCVRICRERRREGDLALKNNEPQYLFMKPIVSGTIENYILLCRKRVQSVSKVGFTYSLDRKLNYKYLHWEGEKGWVSVIKQWSSLIIHELVRYSWSLLFLEQYNNCFYCLLNNVTIDPIVSGTIEKLILFVGTIGGQN